MPVDGDTDGGCSSHKDGCDGTTGMGHASSVCCMLVSPSLLHFLILVPFRMGADMWDDLLILIHIMNYKNLSCLVFFTLLLQQGKVL
jgi:hypothetical protein